jgi:hypothetical protein
MDFKLVYKITPVVQPLGTLIDSDWAGDNVPGRSTAGGIVFIYGNRVIGSVKNKDTFYSLQAKQSINHKPMLLKKECIS